MLKWPHLNTRSYNAERVSLPPPFFIFLFLFFFNAGGILPLNILPVFLHSGSVEAGEEGHSLGGPRRNGGPWINRLSAANSTKVLPRVRSSVTGLTMHDNSIRDLADWLKVKALAQRLSAKMALRHCVEESQPSKKERLVAVYQPRNQSAAVYLGSDKPKPATSR